MSQYSKLYNSRAWQFLRRQQLLAQPLCKMCGDLGHLVGAEVVDHKTPHKGDLNLFLDQNNLQSLCKLCHDKHKQQQERRGLLVGHGPDGLPLDPNHHWNK